VQERITGDQEAVPKKTDRETVGSVPSNVGDGVFSDVAGSA